MGQLNRYREASATAGAFSYFSKHNAKSRKTARNRRNGSWRYKSARSLETAVDFGVRTPLARENSPIATGK